MTKTDKLRYYIARKPKDKSHERISGSYRVSESVNGVVSLQPHPALYPDRPGGTQIYTRTLELLG